MLINVAGDIHRQQHPDTPTRVLQRPHLPLDPDGRLVAGPLRPVRLPLHRLYAE